jgi:hypothetical protein
LAGKARSVRIGNWSVTGAVLASLMLAAMPVRADRDYNPRPQVKFQPIPPLRMTAGEAMRIQIVPDTASPLNRGYPIDQAGFADLPWLGRFQVQGMTPAEVESALSKRLKDKLKGSSLRAAPAMRLGFLGSWARPGEHYLSPDASIWEAVVTTGGPMVGGLGVVQIMRGSDLMMQVNLNNPFAKEATLGGTGIRSGDIFMMPMAVPVPVKSKWESFKEGLTVSTQILAVMGSLLSTYLTYVVLSERGKL